MRAVQLPSLLLVLIIVAAPVCAPAAEADEPQAKGFFGFDGWTGEGQLGGALNTGNTKEKALALAVTLDRESEYWRHNFEGAVDFTQTDGTTTKQRFFAGYEIDYDFSNRTYLFATTSFEDDRFSGYDYRLFTAAGIGYQLVDGARVTWEVEAGPGYRYSRLPAPAGSDSELIGRVASSIKWKISETADLTNRVGVVTGGKTTTIDTLTALTMQINSSLSGRISFETRTDTDRPSPSKKTDTATKATLVYSF